MRVVSWDDKDCTGNSLTATFDNSREGSLGHCFQQEGKSLQSLEALDEGCGRGFVTAFASDDCHDPYEGFLFQEFVGGAGEACHNVVEGYKSFTVGCVAG